MSLTHMVWAFDQRGLAPMEKFVLVALAEYADKTTGECWPSIPRVVQDTGMGESTIRRHIATLVKRGVIVREERFREDGSQTSNRYHFPVTPPPTERGQPLPQREAPPVTARGHEPSIEPSTKNLPDGTAEENGTPVGALVAKYAESTSPPPPTRARARVGRELRLLHEQGYDEYLDGALDVLIEKKLDPSLLPTLVAERLPNLNHAERNATLRRMMEEAS